MNKPNIFSIATKELSQDAFIAWLIKWADESYGEVDDSGLHMIGCKFVHFLLSLAQGGCDVGIDVRNVEVGRQWNNIDIWADINEEYLIVIEDKKGSNEHGDQLNRYKQFVEKEYGDKRKIVCIYLKTGLESLDVVEEIKHKGWTYCGRNELLGFFLSNPSENDTYSDYVDYLKGSDNSSNSYNKYENLYCCDAVQGLYTHIQGRLDEWSHWEYVSNPAGGFLGLWFHFIPCSRNEGIKFYLQIENNFMDKCNLVVKVCGDWNGETDYLYEKLGLLQSIGKDFDLTISKPARYRPGEYSTVAIIDDVFTYSNGKLDMGNLFGKIESAKKVVGILASKS